jgi:hypothetical protein
MPFLFNAMENNNQQITLTPHAVMRCLERGVTLAMVAHVLRHGRGVYLAARKVWRYKAKWGRPHVFAVTSETDGAVITVYADKYTKRARPITTRNKSQRHVH